MGILTEKELKELSEIFDTPAKPLTPHAIKPLDMRKQITKQVKAKFDSLFSDVVQIASDHGKISRLGKEDFDEMQSYVLNKILGAMQK